MSLARVTTAVTAALLYTLGLVPVALRGALPVVVVAVGLAVAAAGTVWLSLALWRAATELPDQPDLPGGDRTRGRITPATA